MALRGDVLVWLDPRAQRFHPSTAMSLAGPLLRMPTLQFIKAYGQTHADKPGATKSADRLTSVHNSADYAPIDMSWGGFVMPPQHGTDQPNRIRVKALKPADLRALDPNQMGSLPPRTILQVLCPSLAAVIAPFSREMAGRRQAMLSVPAITGENLELGLLLSIAAEYGTRSIAQVELRHAQPAPTPPPTLRNAIDTLQVLARRLQDPAMRRYAADTAERLQRGLNGEGLRGSSDAGDFALEVRALGPVERPPMQPILDALDDH